MNASERDITPFDLLIAIVALAVVFSAGMLAGYVRAASLLKQGTIYIQNEDVRMNTTPEVDRQESLDFNYLEQYLGEHLPGWYATRTANGSRYDAIVTSPDGMALRAELKTRNIDFGKYDTAIINAEKVRHCDVVIFFYPKSSVTATITSSRIVSTSTIATNRVHYYELGKSGEVEQEQYLIPLDSLKTFRTELKNLYTD